MVDDDKIKKEFGEDEYKYLKSKCIGGKSNQKGVSYEGLFAVYQIALNYPLVKQQAHEIFIETQVDNAFVDDLVLEDRTENHINNFQLKNCDSNLTWTAKKHRLKQDFLHQYKLNKLDPELLGKVSNIVLVLSSETNFRNTNKKIPKEIKDFTQVCLFRSAKNLRDLFSIEPKFKNAISNVCAKPDSDKLETAACEILAIWLCQSGKVSVSEIMQKIVGNVKNPSYIRTFDTEDISIDLEVREILEGIGIVIEISRGYLHLEYPEGLSKKTYGHALGTEEFKEFEKWLKEKKPSSWDDIKLLMKS
jgi:hypothetical protein